MFTLPDEMAGEMFQCTKCARLVTVPTLDDLQHIQEDGTYDIGDIAAPTRRVDHAPVMSSEEANSTVGRTEDSNPYDFDEPEQTNAPRYDPFTGELVRAHEVIETEDSAEAKKPKVQQPITKMRDRGAVSAVAPLASIRLLGEMFMARNVSVLLLMLVLHVLMALLSFFIVAVGFFFFFFVPAILVCICLGYYAIIVQETGPGDRDELPTPMRTFDGRTDIWDPFAFMLLAILLCFGPTLYVEKHFAGYAAADWVGNILFAVGMFMMPSVFLTAAVGGIVVNFRPDRLLGVIWKSGVDYLFVVIAWGAGIILITFGWLGMFAAPYSLFRPGNVSVPRNWFLRGAGMSAAMMAAGLYLSFYACWLLGLIWRKHYAEFPWVGQHWIKKEVVITPPQRRKKKPAPPIEPIHFEAEHPELEKEPSR
jgi:hypothetical protein